MLSPQQPEEAFRLAGWLRSSSAQNHLMIWFFFSVPSMPLPPPSCPPTLLTLFQSPPAFQA